MYLIQITKCILHKKRGSSEYSAPKSLDKFIINFDNNELDNLSGSFRLNLV